LDKIKVASLFSGIGGFETGIFDAIGKDNVHIVLSSENDKYANSAYEILYGNPTRGDITKIDGHDVPDHDILVGGFPCQSFSIAGKRQGFNDTRGTMFFEIARIVSAKKPKAILLENVKGLINHDKGKTLEVMLEVLSDEGYVIDFDVLNSKYFDVPQNRGRIILVALREVDQQEWDIKGNNVVAKAKKRLQQNSKIKTFNFNFPENNTVTKSIRDILEQNVDEKYYISQEKTEKLLQKLHNQSETDSSQLSGRFNIAESNYDGMILDNKNGFGAVKSYENISPTLLSNDYKEPKMIVEDMKMVGLLEMKGNESIRRVYSADGISPTVTAMGGGHREPKVLIDSPQQYSYEGEGISYCLDANYTKGTSPGDIGKGRRTHVVEYNRKDGIGKELDIAHTLNSSDYRGLNRNQTQTAVLIPEEIELIECGICGSEFYGLSTPCPVCKTITAGVQIFKRPQESYCNYKHHNQSVLGYRIRKLTPLECFRLQGFPDEYYYKLANAGISDSQLYKMAGNAVTTKKIKSVFENLIPYIR
jgi:DNA (cytosine-5)-methyltransferase 1